MTLEQEMFCCALVKANGPKVKWLHTTCHDYWDRLQTAEAAKVERTDTSTEGLELAYAEALSRAKEAEAKARHYHNLLVDWRQYFRWEFAISPSGELAGEDKMEALIERTKEATQ